MSDQTQGAHPLETPKPRLWRVTSLVPIVVFAVLAVFLGVGLTLNPREIPSPLISMPVPESNVIDREGRIAYKHIGAITPKFVEETLRPLIGRLRQ